MELLPKLRGEDGGESVKYDLCGACAAKMKEAYKLKELERPADNKITCDRCGRRRYGGKYELLPKMEDRRDEND